MTRSFSRPRRSQRPKRNGVAECIYRRDVMLVGHSCASVHQVGRSRLERDLMSRATPWLCRRLRSGPTVRAKLHSTGGEERDPGDDVILGGIAVPPDRRTGPVFIDERHREGNRFNVRPFCHRRAQRKEEGRNLGGGSPIVPIRRRTPRAAWRRLLAFRSQQTSRYRSRRQVPFRPSA